MNTKSKTKASAALLLAAVFTCACSSVDSFERYKAKKVTTTESPDGTKQKVEEGVEKETKNSKTEVKEPTWLIMR